MSGRKDIETLLTEFAPRGVCIDLACGTNKQEGFIGVDILDLPEVDVVHDLETFPWPFPDDCARFLLASHIVEHINPAKFGFLKFMDEAWRVLHEGGILAIATPYAGSAGYWQDPTHVNPCSERTWAYFDASVDVGYGVGELWRVYKPKPWEIIQNSWDIAGQLEVALKKRRLPQHEEETNAEES